MKLKPPLSMSPTSQKFPAVVSPGRNQNQAAAATHVHIPNLNRSYDGHQHPFETNHLHADNSQARISHLTNQPINANINYSLSTLQNQTHTSSAAKSSHFKQQTKVVTGQESLKQLKRAEAEVQRINKLMNVNMGTFKSNVARLRIQR